MSSNNKFMYKKMVDGCAVWYCNIENTRVSIPARKVPYYYAEKLCKYKKWTYTDSPADGGIDAVTPAGKKHFQIKCLADNASAYTDTREKFASKAAAYDITETEIRATLAKYCECFDGLVIYITKYRGDAFNPKNALILYGADMLKWLYKHCRVSYMNCGKQFYRQFKFTKSEQR